MMLAALRIPFWPTISNDMCSTVKLSQTPVESLTVFLAAEVLGAFAILAHRRVSVFRQAVEVGALKGRAEHLCFV